MSFTVTNTFQNSLTPAAFTSIGFTGTAGRSFLLVTFQSNSDLITGISDDAGNAYVQDASLDIGGNGRRAFRCQSISGAPTQIRVNVSSGTEQQVHLSLVEVTGLAATSPFEAFTSVNDGGTTTHSLAFTTANAGCFALVTIGYGQDAGTPTGTGGWTAFTHTTVERDGLYIADTGAAGSKALTFTSGNAMAFAFIAVYKTGASGPTVSTITGTTATEGSAVVFTVTMSGTGGLTDAYSWSGTAGSGDYTQTLTDGMFTTTGGSGSVTVSGGNIVVPSAVTAFEVAVPTTGDTLDEDAETIRLVFGGVTASSGTITDDDATPALLIPGPVTVDSGDSVVASYTLGAVSGRVTYARLVLTDGTKVGGVDYTNVITDPMLSDGVTISAGVLSIPAGVAGFTITIPTAA